MKIDTKVYLKQQLDYERFKAENIKLRSELDSLKKKFDALSKLVNPLQSKISKITKVFKPKNVRRNRKSTEKENRSHRNGKNKLSSTKIQGSTDQSISTTNISSILSMGNTINSSLLTNDGTESLSSIEISSGPSFSSRNLSISSGIESSVDERYETASMSFITESRQSGLESTTVSNSSVSNDQSSLQSHNDLTMSSSYESNSIASGENAQNVADTLINSTNHDLSDVIRNASQSMASMLQSQLIPRDNIIDLEMEVPNSVVRFDANQFSFLQNTQKEAVAAVSRKCKKIASQCQENEDGLASLGIMQSSTTAKNSSAAKGMVSTADNLNPFLLSSLYERSMEASNSIVSQQNFSVKHTSDTHNDTTFYNNYRPIFNTAYMIGTVKYFSNKDHDFKMNESPEKSQEKCACCYCKNGLENHEEFRDLKHLFEEACQRGKPKPKLTQSKYTKQVICDGCMSCLTRNSKKSCDSSPKAKKYHCCFHSCSNEFSTKSQLQKHYLKHLKVKNFVCPVCAINFSTKIGLRNHERKHLSQQLQNSFQ